MHICAYAQLVKVSKLFPEPRLRCLMTSGPTPECGCSQIHLPCNLSSHTHAKLMYTHVANDSM